MFKKILGSIIMAICIAAGLFMVESGHYLTWVAIIGKNFADFWVAFAIVIFGWIIGLGGASMGMLIRKYDEVDTEIKDKLKDLNKQINKIVDKEE